MYKLTNTSTILLIEGDTTYFIKPEEHNRFYIAYLSWLEEGNTPEPADPIPEPVQLTAAEKLAMAGLSVDELKELLGL